MRVELTLNGSEYAIEVDRANFTAIKVALNETKDSVNFGKKSDRELGYFTKMSDAAKRLCREEIASSPDTVSLMEAVKRIEAINKQLTEQLEAVLV